MSTYLPRIVDALLARRLQSAGAVVIEGPKSCGKTRTAERVAKSETRLDVDQHARDALLIEPSLVLSGAPPQLVDEWQLEADIVWNHVRRAVDDRSLPGQFILTGSSVPDDDARRHTGAGRFARLTMRPMSLFESGESTGSMSLSALMSEERPVAPAAGWSIADVSALIVRGGWPLNLKMDTASAAQANVGYLRNIVQVDVPRLDGTYRDPDRVLRVIQSLARNTAMERNVKRTAADSAIDDSDDASIHRTTVSSYLGALQRLMILDELTAWPTHLRSKAILRTTPRVHLADPSLAAAALNAGSERLLADLNTMGLLFESLVVRDVRVYAEPLDATVHYYRDSSGLEVDIVIQCRDGRWAAIEVKLGAGQIDGAAKHLIAFADGVDFSRVGGPAFLAVVTATGYGYTRQDGVVVVPITAFGP